MIKKCLFLLTVFMFSLSFQSCGVMFGGSRYNAKIYAPNSPDADIYVNGRNVGKSPASGSYARNKELTVTLKQEGCEDHVTTFEKSFRTGNFILSTLFWGILGIGVDLGTGASYKPNHRNDSQIEKKSTKDFEFTVYHENCPPKGN